jgi:hypothetical protein
MHLDFCRCHRPYVCRANLRVVDCCVSGGTREFVGLGQPSCHWVISRSATVPRRLGNPSGPPTVASPETSWSVSVESRHPDDTNLAGEDHRPGSRRSSPKRSRTHGAPGPLSNRGRDPTVRSSLIVSAVHFRWSDTRRGSARRR